MEELEHVVEALRAEGFTPEEIAEAAARDRLALLPVDRVLQGDQARYTRAQVAERAGLPLDVLVTLWRELGLAGVADDVVAFGDTDVDAARAVAALTRVIGHVMARLAETVREVVGEALLEAGDDERSVGLRYAQAARTLVPMLTPVLGYVLQVHLRDQIKTDILRGTEISAGRFDGARELCVCFADLVGFTRLGERVPLEELRSAGRHLTAMTVAVAAPPVRLVKTIGDAAMLVSPDPEALVDAALELVARADRPEEGMPPLRAGIAYGQAIAHSGDWFGAPVNLASRITDVARPSSVVVTAVVRELLEARFAWSYAGTRRFKGVRSEVALYRARRLRDEL